MGLPGGLLLAATAGAALLSAASSVLAWMRPELAPRGVAFGRRLLLLTAALAAGATAALAWALLANDFSLTYVADHSRRQAHGAYRLGGLWGGMAGSLLLWTALLAGVAALGARTPGRGRLRAGAGAGAPDQAETSAIGPGPLGTDPAQILRRTAATNAVLAGVTAAFAATTLLLANPFETLAVPAVDGGGLTPILEHPAMLYHPPLLYLGLVTLVVPFAMTVADLAAGGHRDATIRRWMLAAWTLLAIGMVTGANWAYVEVGWGGYWAWDPIENTALVPWLVTTAYLHARLRRPADPDGRAGPSLLPPSLVLLAFVLASVGTLLTRSGAASSVHAFAQAIAVGRALLAIVAVLIVGSGLALRRATRIAGRRPWPPRPVRITRDTLLSAQVALVVAAVALVLIGMLAPLAIQWVTGDESLVDGSYYARTIAPLAILVLLLTGVGPRLAPGPISPRALAVELTVPVAGGLLVVALLDRLAWGEPVTLALGGAAGFAATSALQLGARALSARTSVGAHLAHLGLAVLLVGVAGSTAATSRTVSIGAGRSLSFDDVEVRNDGAHSEPGPPPRVVTPIVVTRRGRTQALAPAIDGYPERGSVLAETALWSTPLEDVQVALRRADDDGNALLDVRIRPFAQLVWWGGAILVASGIAAVRPRLRRRPSPSPAPRAAAGSTPAPAAEHATHAPLVERG